jgi:hypothetical protein
VQNRLKIGWVLTGDYTLASSRLQGYRVHEYLLARGLDSHIVYTRFGALEKGYSKAFFLLLARLLKERHTVVFFQKPGWMMFKLSEALRQHGVRTVAIQCDPFPGPYAEYFDLSVVSSESLAEILAIPGAVVIDDMLEVPLGLHKTNYKQASGRLRLAWVGQGTGPGGKAFILPFIERLQALPTLNGRVEVVTISRGDWATRQWSLATVYEDILACDAAIIPMPENDWASAKSSNRLTQFMALGMPTIVSPVDSYLHIARQGDNCLIANSMDGFAEAIKACQSEATRKMIGEAARRYSWDHYSSRIIGPLWLREIERLQTDRHSMRPSGKLHTRLIGYLAKLAGIFPLRR